MRSAPPPAAPLGIYLSIPFCRAKCSYCNFASEVFAPSLYREYCRLLADEIALTVAAEGCAGAPVDTVYWGGGTPSLLPPDGFTLVLDALRRHLDLLPGLEHTVEVAPGTLAPALPDALAAAGVNRVSLGVQSFVAAEARAVGRTHSAETVFDDCARLRAAGLHNLSLDLIAGLPYQSESSWRESLHALYAADAPHASIYMLEVDDDSRLGHEILAGGARYHAHHVPDDDLIARCYETACAGLPAHGLAQYEISNFAAPTAPSRHNLRYWGRQPYLGFGLDAHSFLAAPQPLRLSNPDTMAAYLNPLRQGQLPGRERHALASGEAIEETLFLGLRRVAGVPLASLPPASRAWLAPRLDRLTADGLLAPDPHHLRLTPAGRLLSNVVFAEFLGCPPA